MPAGSQLQSLISAEIDDHCARFGKIATELELARSLFGKQGKYVVPDTSFYIEHTEKLEEVEFQLLLKTWEDPVRIVVPMTVVDELDGLKRSRDHDVRWRAGYTLAVLERVVTCPPEPGVLHLADFSAIDQQTGGFPRGEVTLQIAFDPPGHQRLPINDDEIIDGCQACKAFAGQVTMITYDTGQSMRARAAGLEAIKLAPAPNTP
jgi:hypothetical protein